MTVQEKADALIERIRGIYDSYEDVTFDQMDEDDVRADDMVHEIALADYNWNKIMELYESDPAEFLERYGNLAKMDDIDILQDIILAEAT
jgi:hypothetical protein